jgi:hypothetical protein
MNNKIRKKLNICKILFIFNSDVVLCGFIGFWGQNCPKRTKRDCKRISAKAQGRQLNKHYANYFILRQK